MTSRAYHRIAHTRIFWALAFASGLGAPARADSMSAASQDGYLRLSIALSPAGHVKAAADGGVLVLSFDRKTNLDPAAVTAAMSSVIASGHADADGKTLRFALSQPVKLHQSAVGARAVVDLAPQNFTGTMPDLPPLPVAAPKPVDIATLPALKLRAGSYANFTRLVFDWPKDVAYTVFPGAGKITIRFAAAANPDLSVIANRPPPWVKNAAWHLEGSATVVEFETDSDSGFHDFKDGTHVVLDVLAPKTEASAYTPPGTAKPSVTKIDPATAKQAASTAPISKDQAQAIAATAAAVAPQPKNPPAPPVAAKPVTPPAPAAQAAPAPAPTPTPTIQVADGHVTPSGAVLNFKGAGGHPAAVFVRGLTAWIVLENVPAFDSAGLKKSLGTFADGLEAASGPGVSILRVTLKQPAAIFADGMGPDLRVSIGAHSGGSAPGAIAFARNSDDPMHASFTTLLPGADKNLPLTDPVTGDILTVIPATPGRAMAAPRNYAEFAALQTASGLVVTPFADDLIVKVQDARVTISRPGGLALTPPQMPAANSPSELAAASDGPSFMNFAAWSQAGNGASLATERRLSQSVARLDSAKANQARLILARFYLANHFAAEALGEIKLIQDSDTSRTGDPHLLTMRAAAEYMMGRYQDAHNDLSGANFDSDRHAALWRGLTDAAMENWSAAHTELEQAGPVLKRYPDEWQARAHLADAQAGLGLGRLELADAATTQLSKNLSKDDLLESQLVKARIAAMEGRYAAALPGFAAVENGGNEKLAAQAIFYQTDAALNAGAITSAQAIPVLERLRFRWRGDSLELKTLRKLASLYFGNKQWQQGLHTLRVAASSFNGDAGRSAQDDMRAAFVNLFLKGGADKMPPVESLALFYDNIDLTPIGADGDEMIRRMSDRLVAVDLLGPAATLLAYQVDKRLDGVAKADVSTHLAAIYLMDHKPQQAIDVLHNSALAGLPDATGHERLLLEARAFAALKQWDNALDLISVDQADDTRRLRADIYWESGNWDVAGQKTEELLATSWSDPAPLSDTQRAQVLRMAVSYSLANDEAGLDRMRDHFAAKMAGTQDAGAFAALSQSIDMHGLAFRDAARQIASVDTLEAFMKDFNNRHQTVAIN